ncbi:anti-sigma factor [Celeribacter neptunius]|uniref:Anti-sigma-K factor RskA n=1 Tax=Celeribacter neptunius TaxID=588602 RepID=A0A1I3P741_9RHOB|nr:anti-sigma factor [Celeribacter neptunius]SFJ17147.1 Anti-sigma-K factor RskA [Celeribacter neptunius]
MSDVHDEMPPDESLAAEYALGLLEGAEKSAFEARLASEPALVARLRVWEAHFASLAEDITPEDPPARLKLAIEAALFEASDQARLGLWARLRSRIAPGLALGGGLVAAALVLAVWLGVGAPRQVENPALYTVEMAATEGFDLRIRATYHQDGTVSLDREAGATPSGRVLELWLIFDGEAPISLGVMPESGPMVVSTAYAERMAGALFAITDEPPGGAPGGVPTGDLRAAGPLEAI